MATPQAHPDRTTFVVSPSMVIALVATGGGWQFTLKRAADRAVALLALLVLAPLLLAIALGVRLSSVGPVIFRQRRVSRGGETFVLFKFRTMVQDAGVAEFTLTHGTAPGGIEGEDRRTAVGRWLRAISFDELPQLLNVLRGEMSLIGPRPERPEFVELFTSQVPRYSERHRVKSGITGWAQANGLRGQTSIADRVELDNYYIENWSLGLDLRIVALTIVELLRFRDGRPATVPVRSARLTAVRRALRAGTLLLGGSSHLRSGRCGEVRPGVGVPCDSPSALGGLCQQHPRSLHESGIARGCRDILGELLDDPELLVTVQHPDRRQDLDSHVVAVAVDIRERIGGELVHERRRVVSEQRQVGHLLPAHHRRREVLCERVLVGKRARRGVDVDHRHGRLSSRRSGLTGCGFDQLHDLGRVGDHREVARGDLDRGCSHALREHALGVWRDRLVVGGDQVPRGVRLPGGDPHDVLEGAHREALLNRV
jgi:lipopolysaccharide/colanic/teichoic acid biosynthesis glycosyltransferase